MSETPFDLNGDGYSETLAYDDGDGVFEFVALDSNRDGFTDTFLSDFDENGLFESAVQDLNNDGSYESAVSLPNGYSLTISSESFDISGGSGIVAAAEGMAYPSLVNGGLATPTSTSEPQVFDSYDHDSDGDGFSDARDRNPSDPGRS